MALLLCLALLAGCGGTTGSSSTPSPTPTASTTANNDDGATTDDAAADEVGEEWEPATYSVWTWPGATEEWGAKDLNDVLCFQEAEKITNTKIEWVMQSDTATFDIIMASGDIPDAVYYAWSTTRQGQYGASDGLIQNIMPYIQSSAPNLKALIDSDPIIKKQLVRDDGSVYFVPWITSDLSLLAGEGFAIRKDWLDKFGLEIPKTPEELYDVLLKFNQEDANGNGKNDEYVTGYPSQFHRSAYAFGTADGDFHYAEDGKTIVYGPMTDNFREWLRWMSKLYANNLLDPDYFSWDSDLYMAKQMEDRVSLYVDNPGVLTKVMKDGEANGLAIEWVPMQYMQYKGKSTNLSSAYKRYVQPYGLAFSKDVENPERLMKWFDFFFTEQGNDLLNWGVEGVSYTGVGDARAYTETVTNDPELEPSASLSRYASPTFVGIQSPLAVNALSTDFAKECRATWANTDITMAAEPFIQLNAEEQAINTQYRTDLTTIKDSWRDRFITGEKNIETDWDAYVEELKAYKVDELLKINQDASDRYLAK